jgi:hypothetical protein
VTVNMGSIVQKSLRLISGQTSVKRYLEPLTKLIQDKKVDTTSVIVDAPEFLHRTLNQRPAMRRLPDIARHQHACVAGHFDEPLRLAGVIMFIEVGYEQIRPFARKGQRHGAADAGIPASDQYDPPPRPRGGKLSGFGPAERRASQ